MLNINEIRGDFPIFQRETRPGVRVTYLDSTATSQKPLSVIEAMNDFYRRSNVFLTDGWMVPDRILWYPLTSGHIRPVLARKSARQETINY